MSEVFLRSLQSLASDVAARTPDAKLQGRKLKDGTTEIYFSEAPKTQRELVMREKSFRAQRTLQQALAGAAHAAKAENDPEQQKVITDVWTVVSARLDPRGVRTMQADEIAAILSPIAQSPPRDA